MKTAFQDAIKMAVVVAITFDPCDDAFLRYFRPEEASLVNDVFRSIADIPLDMEMTAENIKQILNNQKTIEGPSKFADLDIYYGSAGIPGAENRCAQKWNAFTLSGPIDYRLNPPSPADVAMCPPAFYYPDLWEIINPSSIHRDAKGNPLPGFTCAGLGDHDSDWMMSPGAVLLHEFMHWPYLFIDIPDFSKLINKGSGGFSVIEDYFGQLPPNGNGPFHASTLKFIGPFQAVQNVGFTVQLSTVCSTTTDRGSHM